MHDTSLYVSKGTKRIEVIDRVEGRMVASALGADVMAIGLALKKAVSHPQGDGSTFINYDGAEAIMLVVMTMLALQVHDNEAQYADSTREQRLNDGRLVDRLNDLRRFMQLPETEDD